MLKDGLAWADTTGVLLASLFLRNVCRSKAARDVKNECSFESFDMISWRRGDQTFTNGPESNIANTVTNTEEP
jgi:hypothetical protein